MPALQVGVKGTVFHAEADWLGEPKRIFVCATGRLIYKWVMGQHKCLFPQATTLHWSAEVISIIQKFSLWA
jgi:hypothetical protein